MSEVILPNCLTHETIDKLSSQRNEPLWFQEKRNEAFEILDELKLPESKYTKIKGFNLEILNPFLSGNPEKVLFDIKKLGIFIVQANTSTEYKISPEYLGKVVLMPLARALGEYEEMIKERIFTKFRYDQNKFTALHLAFLNSGVFIYVPDGVELDKPIYIVNEVQSENAGVFSHNLVIVGKNSHVTVVEENHCCLGNEYAVMTNVSEIFGGEGSNVNFISINNLGYGIYNYIERNFIPEKDAKINFIGNWLGSKFTISRHSAFLEKPGSEFRDVQIAFATGSQHFDLTSYAQHISPYTKSDIVLRGVSKDKARMVFYGLVDIEKNAHDSDSFLSEHAMLLNPGAGANAIPSLQIKNANVRAGHAATVGQIDEEQIFYLMTRGLSEGEARKTIVEGFLLPAFDEIRIDFVRERIKEMIDQKWNM
ncbi:MAG: Fe-S cluster assembly protein SufD [Candidatus Kryptonium sp.]|nr:Fe-S cluster assembly protein SufD [Candidatus Kryptonium sp.]MCX7761983.1 Fe-S cluster assembly protein SufD [Candidatus Kryptonium sp.]MDW8108685.1 Fe-S cluster assembly protein SufD [Candidatus Kryptonium sp.]